MGKRIYIALVALATFGICFGSGFLTIPALADEEPWEGDIVIGSDGDVSPSDAPISVKGGTYTLTSDIAGTITIESNDVYLDGDGYTITGTKTETAITADGLKNIRIENFNIEYTMYGISLNEVFESKIMNNHIFGVRAGIWMFYSDDNVITENTITMVRFGSYLYGCSGNKITFNTIHGTTYDYASQSIFGIGLREYSDDNIITGNTIYDMDFYGLYLQNQCNNNKVMENNVYFNGVGMVIVQECQFNSILDNHFHDNYYVALYLNYYVSGNLVRNNLIEDNYDGIWIEVSDLNMFRENVLEGHVHAFWIDHSFDNVLYHNDVLVFEYAFDTYSYYDETTSETLNTWNKGNGEGNYWDDYEGEDTDDDGIGDTDLPHNGVDNYPLMDPYN